MLIVNLLGWWYGRGWWWVLRSIQTNLNRLSRVFAVDVLLRTWFSPWKQVYSPSSFRYFFRNLADNVISRIVGSIVRGTMLLCALVLACLIVITGLVAVVLWPLLPMMVVILPFLSITGVKL